jgi:membrane-associated phospholipid phosphatase
LSYRFVACATLVASAFSGSPAGAQRPDSASAQERTPGIRPAVLIEAGMIAFGGAVALSFADPHLAHEAQKVRGMSTPALRRASLITSTIGGPGPIVLGVGLASFGALSHAKGTQRLGLETTRAVLVSGGLTLLTKGLVGRERPNAVASDGDEYHPGQGFADNRWASFPSGHTSAAFAAAAVLATELGRRHPRQRGLFRAACYGAATLIGVSRVYQNAHWSSDVLAGAALGTLSGVWVVGAK